MPQQLKQQLGHTRPHQPAVAQLKKTATAPIIKKPVAPPVYKPQANPATVQRKAAVRPSHVKQTPAAPPAYRPNLTPKVLQTKTAHQPNVARSQVETRRPSAPQVYRPQPTQKVLQTKKAQTRATTFPQAPRKILASTSRANSGAVVQPLWGALAGAVVGAVGIAVTAVTAPLWVPTLAIGTGIVATTAALGHLAEGQLATVPTAEPITKQKRKKPKNLKPQPKVQPPRHKSGPRTAFKAPVNVIDYSLISGEDPEVEEHREAIKEYKALWQILENLRITRRMNNEAIQWRAQNTANRNRAPDHLGMPTDISAFVAIVDGGVPPPTYSTRPYYNGDGVMAGGAVLAGVYLEVKKTATQIRVIDDVADPNSIYFTNGGTHRYRAGNAVDVTIAWWVRWDGARWWLWNVASHTDVEFSQGTTQPEIPLSIDQTARFDELKQMRTQAKASRRHNLTQMWQNTSDPPL
ncbi:MAG TPA: hypothetical protein VGN95_14680 [Pyrinomonadaceae bacterium]|nr:hypothetical protein [Pyrinomonadaceae bacterium]